MIRLGGGWKIHTKLAPCLFASTNMMIPSLKLTAKSTCMGYTDILCFFFWVVFVAYFQGSNLLLLHRELGFFPGNPWKVTKVEFGNIGSKTPGPQDRPSS